MMTNEDILRLKIELSKSRQPFYIASIGAGIGLISLLCAIFVSNKLTDNRFNSILIFAGSALSGGLAGASGIAQQSNNNSSQIRNIENVDIEK